MTHPLPPAAPKADAVIQQLNLGYNLQQDRLLLRVGLSDNTELVLWVTCRMARRLWQLLSAETYLPTSDSIQPGVAPVNAVAQFRQEAQAADALKKMDFATQYQPRREMLNDGALLAIDFKLSGNDIKLLEVICQEGMTVRMNLLPPLILALCNMLQMSVRESGWDIGAKATPLASAGEAADEHTDKNKVLH